MYKSPRKSPVKTLLGAAALAAALGAAAPTFAHGPGCGEHGDSAMGDLRQIDLTVPQQQQIRTVIKNSRDGKKGQFQDLMQQRRAFEKAIPGTAEFNTAYGSYTQAAAAAAQARIKSEADLRTQIYNLLTQDQRNQMARLKSHQH